MLHEAMERVTITPENYERIMAKIMPKDQRRQLTYGDVISYYRTEEDEDEPLHITIWHNHGRAAACWVWDSEWGNWDEVEQTITLDEPGAYGERIELHRCREKMST